MIVIRDVMQGSVEWLNLRRGIPTASRFSSILTPKTHEYSKAAESYMVELLTERLTGVPLAIDKTEWMTRGSGLEEEAANWYAFGRDVELDRVGFCYTDDKKAGCSPDALVGEDGGLEIKCPSAHVHVGHLLRRSDPANPMQIQGNLWVTGRAWWDSISYCPGLPPVLIRFHRDERVQYLLGSGLKKFNVALDTAERMIAGLGVHGRREGFGDDEGEALVAALYASLEKAET